MKDAARLCRFFNTCCDRQKRPKVERAFCAKNYELRIVNYELT